MDSGSLFVMAKGVDLVVYFPWLRECICIAFLSLQSYLGNLFPVARDLFVIAKGMDFDNQFVSA